MTTVRTPLVATLETPNSAVLLFRSSFSGCCTLAAKRNGWTLTSLVFRAEPLKTTPGTFVPALMLERQLSGLF